MKGRRSRGRGMGMGRGRAGLGPGRWKEGRRKGKEVRMGDRKARENSKRMVKVGNKVGREKTKIETNVTKFRQTNYD